MPFTELFFGVATNFIYDKARGFGDKRKAKLFIKQLKEWEISFEKKHDGTIITDGAFYTYIQRQNEIEAIFDFFANPKPMVQEVFIRERKEKLIHSLSGRTLEYKDYAAINDFYDILCEKSKRFLSSIAQMKDKEVLYETRQIRALLKQMNGLFHKSKGVKNPEDALNQNRKTDGLIHLNASTLEEYKKSIEHTKPVLRINSNIETLIKASLMNLLVDFSLSDTGHTLQKEVGRLLRSEAKAVFIIGDSGIGKTSALVQIAVSLAQKNNEHVLLTQLGNKNDEAIVDSLIDIADAEPYREQRIVVFIDNPYDNPDELLRATRRLNAPNVQFVISERLNRISLIADEFLPEEYCDLAHCIVLFNKDRQLENLFVKRANVRCYTAMADWKKNIITQLFNTYLPICEEEDEESDRAIFGAIDKTYNKNISIVENFYRIAVQYNKQSDVGIGLNRHVKIKLDWDEWLDLFKKFKRKNNADNDLKEIFPFIAALDLFKIKASVQLVSKLTGLGLSKLDRVFRERLLSEQGSEPAAYYTDGNAHTIALKHDAISELYFDFTEKKPSFFLKEVIKYLDEDTIISFEKVVFKRRYVQKDAAVPAGIDVLPLLQEFCSHQHQDYLVILEKHNRLYSLELAKVWSIPTSQSDDLAVEWKKLLEKYNKRDAVGRKVWASYFDDCERRGLAHLELELGEKLSDNSFQLRRLLKKDDFDANKVCSLWNEVLKEHYSEGTVSLQEFRQLIIDYARHEFPMPEEITKISRFIEYQIVNSTLQTFESFVKKNGLNEKRFYMLGICILKEIAEQYPNDSHSRMTLARFYEQTGDLKSAIDTSKSVLAFDPHAYRALNSLGDLCAKRARMEFPTTITKDEYDKLCADAVYYFSEAATHVPEHERAVVYTALANFQFRTMRRHDDALASLKDSLKYRQKGTEFPTYVGMAMIYADFNRANDHYSETEARRLYECALVNCKGSATQLVSAYVPYAMFLYSLGELPESKAKLNAALKLKPKETKALNLIEKIRAEEEWLETLKSRELPANIALEDSMRFTYADPNIFFDDAKRNDIYALIVKFVYSEPQMCDEVHALASIVRNLIKSEYVRPNDVRSYRIQQMVHKLLARLNYNEYAAAWFQTSCFFISRTIDYERYIARNNARWELAEGTANAETGPKSRPEAAIVGDNGSPDSNYVRETKKQFKERMRRNGSRTRQNTN